MRKLFALALLAVPFALAGCSHRRPYYPPPPSAYSQSAQQGFQDGVAAGNRDAAHGAPPDENRHPNFRRPPVPPPLRDEYRRGFSDGYGQAFRRGPGYR